MQSKVFSTNKTLNIGGRLLDLSIPRVMGILNITPDSFYDGGRFLDKKAMLEQVSKMIREGADIIDVGGYSSRPGADDVSEEEERKKVTEAILTISEAHPGTVISVDTFRASVAQAAVKSGAAVINDISGGSLDKNMFEAVAEMKVPYVLMHMRGTPATMKNQTDYANLIPDMVDYFQHKIARLHVLGVYDIVVDPGFGFAKTIRQNFELLKNISVFQILGKPLMAGLSRKSMIWKTLVTSPRDALAGSIALNTAALLGGTSILRVHDVKEAVDCIRLISQIQPENS
jgi:dihydropteroate synthase